jgi:hypothetical protein
MIGQSPRDTGSEDASKDAPQPDSAPATQPTADKDDLPTEVGGRDGPEPTRYGDWEKNGRCIDF